MGAMAKTCGIYAIVNRTNGHLYIGSSVDVQSRILAHKRALYHKTHKNPKLQRAWDRDGEDAFAFLTLFKCDESVVRLLESIALEACRPAYNLTMSVDGMTRLSDETRRRLSETHRGVPKSEAHRRHIGDGHRGKPKSAESKVKQSATMTGRKLTMEHRLKIGDGGRGRVATELARKHMSEAQKGHSVSLKVIQRLKDHPMSLGLRRSAETRKRMSDALKSYWARKREAKES